MPATALARRPPRPWLGIALMAAGVMTLPLMDGLAKSLSEQYHVVQVTWARGTLLARPTNEVRAGQL